MPNALLDEVLRRAVSETLVLSRLEKLRLRGQRGCHSTRARQRRRTRARDDAEGRDPVASHEVRKAAAGWAQSRVKSTVDPRDPADGCTAGRSLPRWDGNG